MPLELRNLLLFLLADYNLRRPREPRIGVERVLLVRYVGRHELRVHKLQQSGK
jgi:hypothetical protein